MAATPALESLAAFGGRRSVLVRTLTSYGARYRGLLASPCDLLIGQLCAFFGMSLYVKFVNMRETTEYGVPWLGSGRFTINCLHYVLFCGQEIAVFTALLAVAVLWRRRVPRPGRWSRSVIWVMALVVLPSLSVIEVLEIAHFKLFLAPLGREELQMISWTGQIVSAGNVFRAPEVMTGLLLVVVLYYLAPAGLWLPRLGVRRQVAVGGVALLASMLTAMLPKPVLTDALLTPHPVLWLLLGSRSGPGLAAAVDGGLVAPFGQDGRRRFVVKEHPANVIIFVLESTRAASVAMYNPTARAGRMIANFTENGVSRFGLRDARFTYIYTPHADAEQVFERSRDPGERQDVATPRPAGQRALSHSVATLGGTARATAGKNFAVDVARALNG